MKSIPRTLLALALSIGAPGAVCLAQAPESAGSGGDVKVMDKLSFKVSKASRTKQGTVKLEFDAKALSEAVRIDDIAGAHGFCPQILLTDLEGMKEYYPMEAGSTCLAGGPIREAIGAGGGSFWLLYSGIPATTKTVSVRLVKPGVLIPDVTIE